jgi:sucrose phosphorylase
VDLYQVNCTFYDALGRDNVAYLVARAIQFFCPGTPQVYYAGFLACENDIELLEKTKVGRDINRPYISKEALNRKLETPIVKAISELIKLRNNKVFNGEFICSANKESLTMRWTDQGDHAELIVDLENVDATIEIAQNNKIQHIELSSLISSYENKV